MSRAWCGRSLLNSSKEGFELGLLLKQVGAGQFVWSVDSVGDGDVSIPLMSTILRYSAYTLSPSQYIYRR